MYLQVSAATGKLIGNLTLANGIITADSKALHLVMKTYQMEHLVVVLFQVVI